jgi:hypothetical protein
VYCKIEKGWSPCLAPAGYLNDFRERTIVRDLDRFDLVKKMWDLLFTRCYTPGQILKIANKDWGYRTRKTPRGGAKELSLSGLYRIFGNPFYCGIIKYAGKQYLGRHEPMISVENFDRAQAILRRKQKPQQQKYEHDFTGVIRCGECGSLITAERKIKLVKSVGEFRNYTYYRCSGRKAHISCSQRWRITEANLREQIGQELKRYQIIPVFRDLALDLLSKNEKPEAEKQLQIHNAQQLTLARAQRELGNLTQMRYRELIEDEEFVRERDNLKNTITRLRVKLDDTELNGDKSYERTEAAFNFVANASNAFAASRPGDKKQMILTLGLNQTLKDGKFSVQAAGWLNRIQEDYPGLLREYTRFELMKNRLNTQANEILSAIIARWSRTVQAVRTNIQESKNLIIIDLKPKNQRPMPSPFQSPQVHSPEEKF